MSSEPTPELPLRKLPADGVRPPSPMPRPKLSIAHLMLWTLGTAIVLALSRLQLSAFEMPGYSFLGDSYDSRLQTYFRLMAIATAPSPALPSPICWNRSRSCTTDSRCGSCNRDTGSS